jgi:sugar-specific transcriptional regulator TrmB
MSATDTNEQAVGLLQELGLKEYEAKCFVGLARLPQATAKELGELTEVPRTRVYDAIRVLEAKGLVEIQHGSPQRFRAVPVEEGLSTLEDHFDSRLDALSETLRSVEPADPNGDDADQEVWSLTGLTAVGNRTEQLIEEATSEVVLIVGSEAVLTDGLVTSLNDADHVSVIVGTLTPDLEATVRERVPDAKVFTSDLPWLQGTAEDVGKEASIGRILLVDRNTIMVTTISNGDGTEQAVFSRGIGNGLVVIARRIMATGLVPSEDPGSDSSEGQGSGSSEA